MRIKEVFDALERFAPLPLQEDWDNAGLQIGLTAAEASGALLCLDVTEGVVDEAIAKGCNIVVAHHPLIFRPLRRITGDDPVQRAVIKAVKHDIAIVAMHTNMDNAVGGVNYKIAEKIGLQDVELLAPKTVGGTLCGSGVIGQLKESMDAMAFINHISHVFDAPGIQCNQLLSRQISRVALCGGAGDFMLPDAVKAGADAFLTGEMHYHQYFGYEQKLQICVVGHYESEQFTTEIFHDIITSECQGLNVVMAHTKTNPITHPTL